MVTMIPRKFTGSIIEVTVDLLKRSTIAHRIIFFCTFLTGGLQVARCVAIAQYEGEKYVNDHCLTCIQVMSAAKRGKLIFQLLMCPGNRTFKSLMYVYNTLSFSIYDEVLRLPEASLKCRPSY